MLTKLFLPADALMNRMSFSKKFSLLGMITLIAVGVALFSLYIQIGNSIGAARQQLQGLALIKPIAKNVQLFQEHRGLSSGVLSGINDLSALRTAKEQLAAKAFKSLDRNLPVSVRQLDAWKNIAGEWHAIQTKGMQWTRSKNFIAHTQLVDNLLLLQTRIGDDYGLTADPNLNTFYLDYVLTNDLLHVMEQLGQIRAYGIGILGARKINEQQRSEMVVLTTLLQHRLKPLKVNLDKAAHYNPSLQRELSETYRSIDTSSHQVINEVGADILSARFSLSPIDYLTFTTKAINDGYTQLYQSLLPTAENLIQSRIERATSTLHATITIAGVLFFMVLYFMLAIHRTTLGSIAALTQTVLGFVRGDMADRVHLETHDELTTIGDGFNTMADELTELIAGRQQALDLLMKIAHSVPGVVYQFRQREDGARCFPFASEGLREIYGISPEEVREDGSQVFAVTYPADVDKLAASIQISAQNLTLWHHEYRVQLDDGAGQLKVKWLLGNAVPERESDGATLWHGFITDITERKQAENDLKIAAIAFESKESMMVTDANSVILRVNHAFTKLTGYSVEEAIGQTPKLLDSGKQDQAFYTGMRECINKTGAWEGEVWNRRKNGEIYPEYLTITAVKDAAGVTTNYVGTHNDITKSKAAADEIKHLAFYDPLTKLPNRRLLNDRLNQTIATSKRTGSYGALMFLDLDNFKPLNDIHGHGVGDMLLIEAANRLTSCIREVDTVARFGGDEFVVMLSELDTEKAVSTSQAAIVAEKIRMVLSAPYAFTVSHAGEVDTSVEHRCTGSIGVIVFNGTEGNQDDIMKWADVAMYEAKDAGRNQIRFYGEKKA